MFGFISYCSEIKIILSCHAGFCKPLKAVKGSKFQAGKLDFN